MAVVHKGETITPAKKEAGSEGGLLGKLSQMAKQAASFSPMGMMSKGLGSLFGGGEKKDDPQILLLKEINANLKKYLENPVPAIVDANQAAMAVNTANTYST